MNFAPNPPGTMRGYEIAFRLKDYVSGPLADISRRYSTTVSQIERYTTHFQGSFNRLGSLVDRLKNRLDFRRAGQSMQAVTRVANELRGSLNRLADRVRIRVDSTDIDRANRQARQLANGIRPDRNGRLRLPNGRFAGTGGGGGGSGGFGLGGFGVGGLLKQALPYVSAAAIGGAALSFGGKAMAQERDEFSLGVMLKSKAQARGLMAQFEDFATKNPLMGMKETTEAGTRLVSLNERTDRVMPIIKTFSDIAAGTKGNLGELITVLGQVKSKGHLMAEENNQFKERQLNLNPYLAKVLGIREEKLAKAMEKGQVGYEQVLRAANLMTTKGGLYENMSERTGAETTYGKFQNLLESLELQFTKLATRALPYVNSGLEWATGLLDSFQTQLNGPLGTGVLLAIDGFSQMGKGLWQFAKDTGLVAGETGRTGTAMRFLITGLETVGNLARWIGRIAEKVGPYLKYVPGFNLLAQGGDALKAFNRFSNDKLGTVDLKRKPVEGLTPREKWLQANGLTGLSGSDQQQRYEEARWRSAQAKLSGAAFAKLTDTQKHTKFLSAQAKELKNNTGLLGASGLMESTKESNKKAKQASGIDASTGGARSTNITINLKSLVERLEIHAGTVGEGLNDMESQVTEILLRVLNSGNTMPT